MPRFGFTAQKVLLLLLGGAALALSGSPRRYGRVLMEISREWRRLERRALYRAIRRLYDSKLISYKERADGSIEIILSREGQHIALSYKLDEMCIARPRQWDRKWRVVTFDIPEKYRKVRDALRQRLRQLGFIELHKSVFVYPFECRNEIDFIIDFYEARRFVRFIEASFIDNELHLKHKFGLA